MIAGVYARKSTEQSGIAAEARSVVRQVDHAKHYAASKGWTVDERFIFVDDGISGAEFENRPGLVRLMASLGSKKQKPPFQILIMAEGSRLGRESIETAYILKRIVQAGVRVFHYQDDREAVLDSPTDKIVLSIKAIVDETEREQARQRAIHVSFGKARAGLVTGGRVYGYSNTGPKGRRELQINPDEAAVVVKIYELYSQGFGFRHVAHVLNEQRVPTPRAQRGRPNGWDQGTIKAVLERSIYRGVIEFGKTRKRDTWGRKNITKRPADDLVRTDRPDLRIISPELEAAVDALRADKRQKYLRANDGKLLGRPVLGKYLLSGLLRCPCGANFEAQKAKGQLAYVCSAHRRKGSAVCANALALPVQETDDRILSVIEGEVLTDAFVEHVLDTVYVDPGDDHAALEAEAVELEQKIGNLTEAIGLGGNIPALVESLKATQTRLVLVRRQLEPREHQDRAQLRDALNQRVTEWKGILRNNPAQARQVLHHLLGIISLWVGKARDLDVYAGADPRDKSGKENITADDVRWSADAKPAGLLTGLRQSIGMASPRGTVQGGTMPIIGVAA